MISMCSERKDDLLPITHIYQHCTLDRVLRRMQGSSIAIAASLETHFYPLPQYKAVQSRIIKVLNAMLNSKKLTELLSQNVHPKLFPKWLVMSPNATLLAYTGPANIKELRDQAALVSILWKEAELKFKLAQSHPSLSESTSSSSTVLEGCLETLTIETDKANIIVRAIQPRLLLVLIGGIPPRRKDHSFKVTPEARGSARYPPISPSPIQPSSDSVRSDPPSGTLSEEHESPPAASATSNDQPGTKTANELFELDKDVKFGLLHIQRKKIDAATENMRLDFQSKGFVMPDDSSIP